GSCRGQDTMALVGRVLSVAMLVLGGIACSGGSAIHPAPDADAADVDAAGADRAAEVSGPQGATTQPSQQSLDPPGYEAWWYPECETADGSCPSASCRRNSITVEPDLCAPYRTFDVGCVSVMTVTSGLYCYVRESNGEHIWSLYPPKGGG